VTGLLHGVDAEPYRWPYDGQTTTDRVALLCIDWQTDFCGPGGYVNAMGYDLALTRGGLKPTAKVLDAVRSTGMAVLHTRAGSPKDGTWSDQRFCTGSLVIECRFGLSSVGQ